MTDRRAPSNTTAHRLKTAMIPILGLILLSFAFRSGHKPVVPAEVTQPIRPPITSSGGVTVSRPSVVWPSAKLSEVLAHNPFAASPSFLRHLRPVADTSAQTFQLTESSIDLSEEVREALDGRLLRGLIQTNQGFVALIGDEVVREGDQIGDRLRVKTIRSGGVELELISSTNRVETSTAPQTSSSLPQSRPN